MFSDDAFHEIIWVLLILIFFCCDIGSRTAYGSGRECEYSFKGL